MFAVETISTLFCARVGTDDLHPFEFLEECLGEKLVSADARVDMIDQPIATRYPAVAYALEERTGVHERDVPHVGDVADRPVHGLEDP